MNNNKYQKFIIYKISQKNDPTMVYIGSSINFKRRKAQHIKNTKNRRSKSYNYPLYQYIRNSGGWDNFDINIYQEFPCDNKIDGLTKEKEIIELLKSPLNTISPIKK